VRHSLLRSTEVAVVLSHPAELTLQDISKMSRTELIEQLLIFKSHGALGFSENVLDDQPIEELRGLLYAARRLYHSKGY
jgi:hypothetical protein